MLGFSSVAGWPVRCGVLVSVPGQGIPLGQKVRIALTHPSSGEAMAVAGTVVREIGGEDGVSALAIRFDPEEPERPDVERFVDGIQSVEHARRHAAGWHDPM